MAITKILGKNHRLDTVIRYVTNGEKTDEQILTDYINCDPGYAYQQMMDTKRAVGKLDGRQCYHIRLNRAISCGLLRDAQTV